MDSQPASGGPCHCIRLTPGSGGFFGSLSGGEGSLTGIHCPGDATACRYRNPRLQPRVRSRSQPKCARSSASDPGPCSNGTRVTAASWSGGPGASVPPMSTPRDFPQGAPKGKSVPYVTHGHADHFFGFAPLLERLPHAKAVATPELVTAMRAQLVPDSIDGFWHRLLSRRNSRTAVGGRATGGWSTGSGGTHARHFECGTNR